MKKLLPLLLGVALSLALSACTLFCEHEYADATCLTPQTCTKCGETSGEALGHTWTEATCTEAKKCSVCGEISGEALGHSWTDATCTEAKKCSTCGEASGEALGHTWKDATCKAPKTCTKCNETTGEKLEHTWEDATCTEAKKCSVCKETDGTALGHAWKDATCTEAKKCTRCNKTTGTASGHTYKDATCTEAPKCSNCGKTTGKALGHDYKQTGLNGSKIKYKCSRCSHTYEKEMEKLKVTAEYTGTGTSFGSNGINYSFGYEATASGGYGKYQYKFEVFSGSEKIEHLTVDFSDSNSYGISSPYGALAVLNNTLKVTVKDSVGNQATYELDMTIKAE